MTLKATTLIILPKKVVTGLWERTSHRARKSAFTMAITPLAITKLATGNDTKAHADHDARGNRTSMKSAITKAHFNTLSSIPLDCNVSG